MTDEDLKQTLYQILAGQIAGAQFSLDEIEALCLELNVDFDNIKGDTKLIKAKALVEYLANRGRLLDLAQRVYLARPNSQPVLRPYFDAQPSTAEWRFAHVYGEPEHFTGRMSERALLSAWLRDDAHPLLAMVALGGFGKSALTWHWLNHDLPASPTKPARVLWWSFYESAASFGHFVASGAWHFRPQPLPSSPRERLTALLDDLREPGTLLVLDGFERELRAFSGMGAAYQGDEATEAPTPTLPRESEFAGEGVKERECTNPLAADFLRAVASRTDIRGKVLLTTRLLPSALEQHAALLAGCRQESLTALAQADALALFRTERIEGSDAEIVAACNTYGCHPLSLRLLAGLVKNDFEQLGDIRAAQRLNVTGDLRQRQNHVLAQAYERLPAQARDALHTLACFRAPVLYATLRTLGQPDNALRELLERGLVQRLNLPAAVGRPPSVVLDLHPIVRRYTYERMTGEVRVERHTRLRDYFAVVETPANVRTLDDLQPVIELYHHTLRTGQLDEALELFSDRLSKPLYFQLGVYELIIDLLRGLFPNGEDHPPHLRSENDRGWTLSALAASYSHTGQPHLAVPLLEAAILSTEKQGHKLNLAIGLGNVALNQAAVGLLRAAEAGLRRSVALCREVEIESFQSMEQSMLGRVLSYRGQWAEAEQEFAEVIRVHEAGNDLPWAYRALRALLMLRDPNYPHQEQPMRALTAAQYALNFSSQQVLNIVQAHWLLGAAQRAEAGDLAAAQRHLDEALSRCRRINLVDIEGDILIEMARVAAAQNDDGEAERLASEALRVAERCGYVLQQADAHLELAKLMQRRNDAAQARQHAQRALACATCDGPPDYTYKVAYDEALALLAALGKGIA